MAIRGYWKLNGNANDFSGNGNHGTSYSITYGQAYGKVGQGAKLDGVNTDYIDIPSISTDYITVSFWMKCSIMNSYYPLVVHKDGASRSGIRGWSFYLLNSGLSCEVYNATTSVGLGYTFPSVTSWNHVVMTFNGSYARLYVNGVLRQQSALNGTLRQNTDTVRIGLRKATGTGYDAGFYNGSVDDLIIDDLGKPNSWAKNEFLKVKGFF